MTIQDLKDNNLIVLEAISGSHAYGLQLPTSDVDIKGVFVLPKKQFYGLDYVPQVNDEKNDTVYYELRRFVELLAKNNPNILELLASPEDSIQYVHPRFYEFFRTELVLSKLCKDSFAGYAMTQIRKARGLNKKIVNPMAEEKKTILDFCYVVIGQGSKPLKKWLSEKGWQQENCGLVNIPNMRSMYGLYYDANDEHGFKGVLRERTNDAVLLSSIPKGLEPAAIMSYNQDGYKAYCREYREYWDWVKNRNEARYQSTRAHDKNYDAKNLMHTFRLLNMATEILRDGQLNVRRTDRAALLAIRRGEFEYDTLIANAEEMVKQIKALYETSPLPDMPNREALEEALIAFRKTFYDE